MNRQQLLQDTLCIAAEGGINYWAGFRAMTGDAGEYAALQKVRDHEDGTKFDDITLNIVELGFRRILDGTVRVRPDLFAMIGASWIDPDDPVDAEGADVVIQAGLFCEVRYG